ncbi:MAG: pantoate--beta-alanine ligase [Calditrichaeota bacterium]|nr:MAG: pantoate--beta-alanine ligase [Calditrichota bacterium]
MRIIKNVSEMQSFANSLRAKDEKISFVPTMGFLHEGHLSLVEIAQNNSTFVVVSIFVNPTQFGPNEDFDSYPRDFERDKSLLEAKGVDVLFAPTKEEFYSENHLTYVQNGSLSDFLCGNSRPNHFRGVTTVVSKLFNTVKPHIAVFGQKDAQQVLIIKKMVQDLNFDIEILVGEISREKDGLALSSRNKYLSEVERKDALVLSESLGLAEKMIFDGERNSELVISKMTDLILEKQTARIDYAEIVSSESLEKIDFLKGEILIALAVFIGKTRLIDNKIIKL